MLEALAFASTYGALAYASVRFAYQRLYTPLLWSIFISIPIFGSSRWWAPGNMAIGCVCGILFIFVVCMIVLRQREINRWRNNPAGALVLEPPAPGRWMVANGGPFAKGNHHSAVPAQRFAYDLVRDDDESLGSPLVAPIDGIVEYVRDSMRDAAFTRGGTDAGNVPLAYGNLVAIRHEGATVLVCHLRAGSVLVEVGQHVAAGTPIGECGNSGRSYGPHVHIHAQDAPAHRRGDGIPIAFNVNGSICVPLPGDALQRTPVEPAISDGHA